MLSKVGTVTSLRIETVLFGLSGHEKQYAIRINSLTQSVMTEFKWKEMLQVYRDLPEKCFVSIQKMFILKNPKKNIWILLFIVANNGCFVP